MSSESDEVERALTEAFSEAPDHLLDAGPMIYSWRSVEGELAELVASAPGNPVTAQVRSATVPNVYTFQAGDLTIELEHDPATGSAQGRVLPARPGPIELRSPAHGDVLTAEVDEFGVFEFAAVLPGTCQLVLTGSSPVSTNWFTL